MHSYAIYLFQAIAILNGIEYALCVPFLVNEIAPFKECADPAKLNTFVTSWTDCSQYIFCNGAGSFVGECLGGNFFNEAKGNCDHPTQVLCPQPLAEAQGIPWMPPNSIIIPPTASMVPPLDQLLTTGESSEIDDSGQSALACPPLFGVENILYLPQPHTCDGYYACYNGNAYPMQCVPQMYFDVSIGKCQRKELVRCQQYQPVQLECRAGVVDFIPHPRHCSHYFQCVNGYRMVYQCPMQYAWDFQLQACVPSGRAKCFAASMSRTKN